MSTKIKSEISKRLAAEEATRIARYARNTSRSQTALKEVEEKELARHRKSTKVAVKSGQRKYPHTFVFRMTDQDRATLDYVAQSRNERAQSGEGNMISVSEILRELLRKEAERLRTVR